MLTQDDRTLPDANTAPPVPASRPDALVLCSLRIVSVTSDHYLGRRYVMELAAPCRARELRVYRSLEFLMEGVKALGIGEHTLQQLTRELCDDGACTRLDIVL